MGLDRHGHCLQRSQGHACANPEVGKEGGVLHCLESDERRCSKAESNSQGAEAEDRGLERRVEAVESVEDSCHAIDDRLEALAKEFAEGDLSRLNCRGQQIQGASDASEVLGGGFCCDAGGVVGDLNEAVDLLGALVEQGDETGAGLVAEEDLRDLGLLC